MQNPSFLKICVDMFQTFIHRQSIMSVLDFTGNLFATQTPKLQKSSINPQHTQYIQNMFSQINNDLGNFLRHLNSTFHSHGVNFDVTQFHHILFRMITPFQLLTLFKIKNSAEILDERFSNMYDNNQTQKREIKMPLNTQKVPKDQMKINLNRLQLQKKFLQTQKPVYASKKQKLNSVQPKKSNVQTKNEIEAYKKELQLNSRLNSNKNKVSKLNNKNEKQKSDSSSDKYQDQQKQEVQRVCHGGRPILKFEEQMKVQNFVIEQVSLGKSLSMQDIANYAKIIAVKDGNLGYFMASTGWVRNFMRRYPKMRILYERSRNKNKKFQDIDNLYSTPYFRPEQNQDSAQKDYSVTNRRIKNKTKRQQSQQDENQDQLDVYDQQQQNSRYQQNPQAEPENESNQQKNGKDQKLQIDFQCQEKDGSLKNSKKKWKY